VTAARPLRTTRRSALAGGLVLLATTGCELATDRPGAGPTTGSPTGRTPGSTTSDPAEDPDAALVEEVRTEIAGIAALVVAAGRGRPAVRRRLRGYRRLHDRHLGALPGDPGRARRERVSGPDAVVLRRVAAGESRLQRRLADAAVAAESGPLASLLASMSAAVAQQLAAGSDA